MRRAVDRTLSCALALFALLPGCTTITGRLWKDFPDDGFRVETTTHRVEGGALHLARAAGPDDAGPLLAVRARVGGLPDAWRSQLAPFGETAGDQDVGCLVFRGSLRARTVAAILERRLGFEPESCSVVFRQGVGADGRTPLPALVLIQGRVLRTSIGEVVRTEDLGRRLPGFSARRPGAGEEPVATSTETCFAWLPWHSWLEDAPKGKVRYRFVAFTDVRGRAIEDTLRLDRIFRWGGTPDEMASLREALVLAEAWGNGELLCYVVAPVSALLLATSGEIETAGSDLRWKIETEWRVDAHTQVPEGVELAGEPIPMPRMDLIFQTRTRVASGGVGRTVGRILLTPLTLALDVLTLGLGAMLWGLLHDDDDETYIAR